jgi:hypothetical protein
LFLLQALLAVAGHDLTLGTVATSSAQAITWNADNWRDTNTSAEAATRTWSSS